MLRGLRSERGGIATYVANAVMILAVVSIAFIIIAATTNLGTFITDQIYAFMDGAGGY
ncbi:MAG TPA: hypothetical protein VK191_14810 [Symbiobacteriaceae bacterium]|nr:hypothetical protein [Symbiobacteriaceae bacterium]